MKIAVTSPYREGAIISIATGASRAGVLDSFYTTLYGAALATRVEGLPIVGHKLAKELRRRAFASIPADKVKNVASIEELVRIASFRASTGLIDFPAKIMYWVKDRFDLGVAREIGARRVDAVVGMWGSSNRTFAAAGKDCVKVLNFVNSRPRFHNQYLREFAKLADGNGELLDAATEKAVEEELALADIILVPSRFVASQMEEYADKVVLAPYGVDLKIFSPGLPNPKFRCNVLVVGQICYRKGFTTLIEAAKRLPDVTFHAVGPVVVPSLLKNLPPNLKYAGLVLHGDVAAVMRSADVFVLPSFEDAFPLVTMEAMASGTPVIISDHAGTCEAVRHGVDGFIFPAGNVEALCGYILQVVTDPELRRTMSASARTAVEGSHSWSQYSAHVLDSITLQVNTRRSSTRFVVELLEKGVADPIDGNIAGAIDDRL